MVQPSIDEYLRLIGEYSVVPVYREVVADIETPIAAFKKIGSVPAYLLESVSGGEFLGRYSFIGFDPFLVFRAKGNSCLLSDEGGERCFNGSPSQYLEDLFAELRGPQLEGLPRFYGGGVGYFGYDFVRNLERLPLNTFDDIGAYDCHLVFTEVVLIFDHVRRRLAVVVNTRPGKDPQKAYDEAVKRISDVLAALKKPAVLDWEIPTSGSNPALTVNMQKESFLSAVRRAKEYIQAGDILQVVLSQRFSRPFDGDPFEVYRRLRVVNPSPYLFYLDFGDPVVIGSSPEMLIRVEDGVIRTRPIAGTRPRGKDAAEDEALASELLNDPKERAEHIMLVDLGRNDLGRVCVPGTVQVSEFMAVEKYSHVIHIVSEVQGVLSPERSALGALEASFPAGTVSGAPKVRAMEIIEELEPTRRGIYAGAVGYYSFTGNLDTCITIRTIVVTNGSAHVQAGAGIVADSDPEREYVETINKAQALFTTLQGAGAADSGLSVSR
ncbi:MAG: anthranilate synthase component I [Bacillota bacterium]